MSAAGFAQARRRLAAEGQVPVGAFAPEYPEVGGPTWSFLWSGPGSYESLVQGVYDLFERLGGTVRKAELPASDADSVETQIVLPVLGLDGQRLATFRQRGQIGFGPTQQEHTCGFPARHFMMFNLANYFLAPVGPGLLHDNRRWAAVNRTMVNELFHGLRELGLTYTPHEFYGQRHLTHVDGFGFAEVDIQWLRTQLDERWRAVVEGRLTSEEASREWGPGGAQSSADWRLFGIKRSLADIHALMDGVPGGELAAARVFPWYGLAESAQTVGDDDQLLVTGTKLRDQLASALAPHDDVLSSQIQGLPVLLDIEAVERKAMSQRLIRVSDVWNRLLPPGLGNEVTQWYTEQVSLFGDHLSVCHLASPLYGVDIDLSAAFGLWKLGAGVDVMNDAFVVGPGGKGWMSWIGSAFYDEKQWWDG